jgi:hypothetical protein
MPLSAVSAPEPIAPSLTVDRPGLLVRLATALESEGVSYCQWKGHSTAHRWMAGRGDIDLLVAQEARTAFRRIVGELGFKPALPPGERQMPGVESYFGFDPSVPRLLHLHVHYRLVLGEYWRTSYRLPFEPDLLETAVRGDVFPVPTATYQFLVFVLRVALQQRGRLLLGTGDHWRRGIQIQLDNLEALCDREALAALLATHLPTIDVRFLDRCVASLRGKYGVAQRALLLLLLHRRLRAYSRRPPLAALLNAAAEKMGPLALRRISDERMRLSGGGTVIALVGGDGAGKSTCARELEHWFSSDFAILRAHLGNPPRSLLTFCVAGALKTEQVMNRLLRRVPQTATHLELLRYLCTARDRYRLYEKVQRFTAHGGIALCERYPVSELPSHVGPCIPALLPASPTAFGILLQNAENRYYECMRRPDLLFVLRLDPELAVVRKPEEPAHYVRTRGRAIWETDWTATRAQMVDAGQPLPEVLTDLKARIWRSL